MAEKHIANAEASWQAICVTPDMCKVGKKVINRTHVTAQLAFAACAVVVLRRARSCGLKQAAKRGNHLLLLRGGQVQLRR